MSTLHDRDPFAFVSAASIALLASASVLGGVSVGGIEFVDRNLSGDIVLGSIRGSLAAIDYNNDGYQDLVISDLFNAPNRLFRNVEDPTRPGERTFLDVTTGSGLDDAEGVSRRGNGVVVADYNNDGVSDILFVGTQSGNASHGQLYRGNADGTFTNVSVAAGVTVTGYVVQSVSWVDFDYDGLVDICYGARVGSPSEVVLLRNNGDGTFSDAGSYAPNITGVTMHYSHLWTDYDNDGFDDGFFLTLGRPPVVLHNIDDGLGGRMFEDSGPAIGFSALGPAPMGISSADYDNDGDFDVALTNGIDGMYYENVAGSMVLRTFPDSIWGWGICSFDADNDGDVDMYQAGSFGSSLGDDQFDKLFRNNGGWSFDDASAALNGAELVSQYAIQIDYDNDGLVDIVTVNPASPGNSISVYENVSATGNHWFGVSLAGDALCTNASAVGAVVRITAGGSTQIRQVRSGTSTTSTEDLRVHVGIGSATQVDSIEVVWPRPGTLAQRTQTFIGPFSADQYISLETGVCDGDADGDGALTTGDISYVIFRLGATGPRCALEGDANQDGQVSIDDISYVIFRLGTPCP